MSFLPISIEKYVTIYLKDNSSEKERDVRKHLERALADYQKGINCSCGNDIWVIGSAAVGNSCFTCITGEAFTDNDYELDIAITKKENKKNRKHIDDMDKTKIFGIFDDDGYEINASLIKKPSLCISCKNNNNPEDLHEEDLCNLTRHDQKDEEEFVCYAYQSMQ